MGWHHPVSSSSRSWIFVRVRSPSDYPRRAPRRRRDPSRRRGILKAPCDVSFPGLDDAARDLRDAAGSHRGRLPLFAPAAQSRRLGCVPHRARGELAERLRPERHGLAAGRVEHDRGHGGEPALRVGVVSVFLFVVPAYSVSSSVPHRRSLLRLGRRKVRPFGLPGRATCRGCRVELAAGRGGVDGRNKIQVRARPVFRVLISRARSVSRDQPDDAGSARGVASDARERLVGTLLRLLLDERLGGLRRAALRENARGEDGDDREEEQEHEPRDARIVVVLWKLHVVHGDATCRRPVDRRPVLVSRRVRGRMLWFVGGRRHVCGELVFGGPGAWRMVSHNRCLSYSTRVQTIRTERELNETPETRRPPIIFWWFSPPATAAPVARQGEERLCSLSPGTRIAAFVQTPARR